MPLVLEYARLAILPHLTDIEADRLGEILEVAIEDSVLDFLLTEIDHIICHRLGLLSENDRESYEDQQAMMREYGSLNDSVICPKLDIEACQSIASELDPSRNLKEETQQEQQLG